MNMLKTTLCASTLLFLSASALAQSVAVIVNPKNASAPSAEQISNIFLGKSNDLTGVDLPDSNPVREAFYQKVTGKDGIHGAAPTEEATNPNAPTAGGDCGVPMGPGWGGGGGGTPGRPR